MITPEVAELSAEDRNTIRSILLAHVANGVESPLLPTDVDLDGDGIVDAFGLGDEGEIVFVSGVTLATTVYRADEED
ncbi:MAG: hypothetical protein K0S70_109 [Microbacterium sp.]|jgi:hypothetical protein|nr:hypothetical protein [Microbacterium sp.]